MVRKKYPRVFLDYNSYPVKINHFHFNRNNMTTFSITSYYDPYGDGKSDRKVARRTFYHTNGSVDEVKAYVNKYNITADYYNHLSLVFKPYKRTKEFSGYL